MINKILKLITEYKYSDLSIEDKNKFIEELKNIVDNKKIVILGAGITGKLFYESLKKFNIHISYFTDKNAKVLQKIDEIAVYDIKYLENENDETLAIIAGNHSIINSIKKDLQNLNLSPNINIIDGDELISVLKCATCLDILENEESISYTNCSVCSNEESKCSAFKKQIEIRTKTKFSVEPLKPSFPLIGYILGQVCTLNCLHCCEGIPFIENRKMVETTQVIEDIQKLASSTNFIGRIEFIGGEPFLHKGLPQIIEEILKINNIGYIVVFTNGTVLPKENLLKILKHPRVVVNFSSYDETIANIKEGTTLKVRNLLEDFGINLSVYNPYSRSWMDFNTFEERSATKEQFEDYLSKCFISYCHRVHNGVFYGCPHYYTGVQLGKIKAFKNEYITLHDSNNLKLADELKYFLQLKVRESCKYCSLPYDAPTVTPAIQKSKS